MNNFWFITVLVLMFAGLLFIIGAVFTFIGWTFLAGINLFWQNAPPVSLYNVLVVTAMALATVIFVSMVRQ